MALFLTLLDRFKNHIFYERKRKKKLALFLTDVKIVVYLTSLCVNWAFFGTSGPLKRSFHSRYKMPKKAQFTHERVEYKVFLFDEPLKRLQIA
jgi:hypothetical protein